ncbi:conserved hypothetical protein [Pediculus humanus corporis]|uniref:Uncharacterized protein n=1 Tax=Pediculus humanus subsp. corporis TaxID=121224 RepID=E0VN52_PEDHC|nr:uncharacterized protein Phum_PHUM328870 [Pediculus humanus corporis]EEB14818.1 conserved hypothetical protein [Pediculus humanus corporis]
MPMDNELSFILNRRQAINNALDEGEDVKPMYKVKNVYTEFHEFSRKQIKQYEETFKHNCKFCYFVDLNVGELNWFLF